MNATAETPGLKAPWFPYRFPLPKLTNEVEDTVAALEQALDRAEEVALRHSDGCGLVTVPEAVVGGPVLPEKHLRGSRATENDAVATPHD